MGRIPIFGTIGAAIGSAIGFIKDAMVVLGPALDILKQVLQIRMNKNDAQGVREVAGAVGGLRESVYQLGDTLQAIELSLLGAVSEGGPGGDNITAGEAIEIGEKAAQLPEDARAIAFAIKEFSDKVQDMLDKDKEA